MPDARPGPCRTPPPRRTGPQAPHGVWSADRFAWLRAVAACVLSGAAGVAQVRAPVLPPAPPAVERPAGGRPVEPDGPPLAAPAPRPLFHQDRPAARRLRLAGQAAAASGATAEVLDLVQSVLDQPEDAVLPDGRPHAAAAVDLLAGLGPEGRREYERRFGTAAEAARRAALAAGDAAALRDVARRYPLTDAGRSAAARLAAEAVDRGDRESAARLFAGLAVRPDAPAGTRAAWSAVADRLRAAAGGPPGPPSPVGWPLFARVPDRLPAAAPPNLVGGPAWTRDTLAHPTDAEFGRRLHAAMAQAHVDARRSDLLARPASFPLVLPDLVVYRGHAGVVAVDRRTGGVRWRSDEPPDAVLNRVLREEENNSLMIRGAAVEAVDRLTLLAAWQDLTCGTLSTDGRRVYVVRNPDLPRWDPAPLDVGRRNRGTLQNLRSRVNTLFALDLAGDGAVAWAAGGPAAEREPRDTFFLGPPLPVDGAAGVELLVLGESGGEIRLIALDPADGRELWGQPLAAPPLELSDKPVRHLAGLSPSLGGGVLVCPTDSGGVAAVDPLLHTLRWTYRYGSLYREPAEADRFSFRPRLDPARDERDRWLDSAPRIAGGRVLLTPRDSDELHCLDAGTGRVRWTRPRGRGLFVGTVRDGVVLVVGRDGAEGVDLETGADRWRTPLPAAAGEGVPAGANYLVPLPDGELAAVRVSDGAVVARTSVGAELGNLVAADGQLISQTGDTVTGFLSADAVAALLADATPDDTRSRLLRARLHLQSGDHPAAAADLRAAADAAADGDARRAVARTLVDALRRDFPTFAPVADAVRGRLGDDAGRLDRVRAGGLLVAGARVEAFRLLARLDDTPDRTDGRDGGPPGAAAVTADRWASARLAETWESAAPAERGAMRRTVEERLAGALGTDGWPAPLAFAERFAGFPQSVDGLAAAADRIDPRLSPARAASTLARLADAARTHGRPDVAAGAADRLAALLAERAPGPASDLPPDAGRLRVERREAGDRLKARLRVAMPASTAPRGAERPVSLEITRRVLMRHDESGRELWRLDLTPLALRRGLPAAIFNHAAEAHGLVAFSTNGWVAVLDTLTGTRRPRVLWTADLGDGRDTVRYTMQNRSPRRGRGRVAARGDEVFSADGVVLLTARNAVVLDGDTLTARDPLTGAVLWSRDGVPRGSTVRGDDDVLLVMPDGGATARLLRTADGEPLGERVIPRERDRFLERGRRVWSVDEADPAGPPRVACLDVPTGRVAWSRPVDGVLDVDLTGTRLADATTDTLTVLDLDRGDVVLEGAIDTGPGLIGVTLLRSPFGWELLARTADPTAGRLLPGGGPGAVNGAVSAFGPGGGAPRWTRDVVDQEVLLDHPTASPVLAMINGQVISTGVGRGRSQRYEVRILDRRTGAVLVADHEATTLNTFALAPVGRDAPLPLELRSGKLVWRVDAAAADDADPGRTAPIR